MNAIATRLTPLTMFVAALAAGFTALGAHAAPAAVAPEKAPAVRVVQLPPVVVIGKRIRTVQLERVVVTGRRLAPLPTEVAQRGASAAPNGRG